MFIEAAGDDAEGPAGELMAADRERDGYVHNYTRLFAHRPEVYAAWAGLNGAIKANMDPRRYELATVAASRQLRSSYCTLAHGKVLAEGLMAPEEVRDLVADRSTAAIDELEAAVMGLAEKVAADATAVTRADVEHLVALGAAERDVFDVVLTAAARCFFSKVLDAMAAEPDPELAAALGPEVAAALTVGRPLGE
jgi:uncharacterized peroxidase-related enzyme